MSTEREMAKRAAGLHAVSYVEDGMVVGLGTGSTTYYALEALGKRVDEGLHVRGVPTSLKTVELAREFGIPLLEDYEGFERVDLTIDGADEIDGDLNAIKGGGGALTWEKMVAIASEREVIVVDDAKPVKLLGRFPVAVEVIRMGWRQCQRRLEKLGCRPLLRKGDDGRPTVTDGGNYIIDCQFDLISHPAELEGELNRTPGVVENGLFVGLIDVLVVGFSDGRVDVRVVASAV